jgi:RimJ/RimL family protein N-acetyltransferase
VIPPSLRTARLCVRALTPDDAAFIVALLNDPSFLRNIGDRHVRTAADALAYLASGPFESYSRHGFGLCAVELADTGAAIGICGLLQRDELPAPDIGFAYLPEYRSQGFAYEAAVAVKEYAHNVLGIDTLLAIVSPDNYPSIRLLTKLGFLYERVFRLTEDAKALDLYAARAPRLC